jgi:putative protein-disulfide isomerase
MCSWCWAFRPTWYKVLKALPSNIKVIYLLGGLAQDSDKPMPLETRKYVQENWTKIQEVVPGIEFNYDFWSLNEPRRSTYPACRAVISARLQHTKFEVLMTEGIQNAYYLKAQNPSNKDTLIKIALEIGLNREVFIADLASQKVNKTLLNEIKEIKTLPVNGFPSLVLVKERTLKRIEVDYLEDKYIINQIIA